PTVYIQIGDNAQRSLAKIVQDKLNKSGFRAPGIEQVDAAKRFSQNVIIYYWPDDEKQAKLILDMLKEENIDAVLSARLNFHSKPNEGIMEIWLK
ncbi:MAG: hypothetical protein IT245_07670, partial [Bacteroidia bacterium]|nr:hypothetical protein [Bacteroidia bacterium]